jgi:NAD-dependent dihydropyrimidine dehydrogenase PreA subunit
MAVEKIDENLCTGCGVCVEDCSMDVLRMDETSEKAYIKYPMDCMTCHMCEMVCPTDAIYVSPEPARSHKFVIKL